MNLGEVAAKLLDDMATALITTGRSIPSRRYITAGEVADDCEQFVVTLNRLFHGLPSDETPLEVDCRSATSAEFEVRLTKCVPTVGEDGTPPSAANLTTAGAVTINDAQAMQEALYSIAPPGDWSMTAVQVNPPSGGFVAISLEVSMWIDGGVLS